MIIVVTFVIMFIPCSFFYNNLTQLLALPFSYSNQNSSSVQFSSVAQSCLTL